MATAFKKGETVALKSVNPEGPVQALRMTEDGVVQYLVEWTDIDGVVHQRWFDEDQLTGA